MSWTVAQLAEQIGGELEGPGDVVIRGLAALAEAQPGELSFLANAKYAALVAQTRASAVIVNRDWVGESAAALIRVESADRAFASIAEQFCPPPPQLAPGIHPTAVVAPDATLGAEVCIGAQCVIASGVSLGDRTTIWPLSFVGQGSVIGDDVCIHPNVTIREETRIGNRVIIHSGTVVGSDGFGYTTSVDAAGSIKVEKVPQLGNVEIADDVEIGSNVSIDRGRFGATRLGRSVKIDNLVQIAHNVQVGDYSGMASQVGISGSTVIGSRVMLWGQVGIAGHLKIGDGAEIGAQSGIPKDVPAETFVVGSPAVSRREMVRSLMAPKSVEKLKRRVDALEAELAALRAQVEESA